MSIDKDTRAAAAFWREIRRFSERAKPWDTNAIFHEVRPDEVWDPTLIAARVYGDRQEFLAVMAAAGMDTVDTAMKQRQIILPSAAELYRIKRTTGFESQPDLREDFAPIWQRQ